MAKTIIRNRPISTVLKEYCERRKGKVVSSREELHRRFAGLDWNVQKKIITLHLQRTKTERLWAYKMLPDYWDDCFASSIENLWEEYHETRCSWLVVRHLPEEYIKANMESLCQVDDGNYFFIAIRLGHDKDFDIDRLRLSALNYLSVLRITGRACTSEEALSLVKEIAVEVCGKDKATDLAFGNFGSRMNKVYIREIPALDKAFYNIGKMNLEPAIERFIEWSDKVSSDIIKSDEWKELQEHSTTDFDYNVEAFRILFKYILMNLNMLDGSEAELVKSYSERRKRIEEEKEALGEMWWDNPEVFNLVDKFDLEIADKNPF